MKIWRSGWIEAKREKMAECSGQRNSVGTNPTWDLVRCQKGTGRNPVGLEHGDQLSEGKTAKR